MPQRHVVLAACLCLAGCAGSLADPERFGDGGTSGAFVCPSLGQPAKSQVILQKCVTGCHSAAIAASNLDLESPSAASRLVGVSTTACPPRLRVDPVDGGTLQELITQTNPTCTSAMPPGGGLTNSEVNCIVEWTRSLASGGPE